MTPSMLPAPPPRDVLDDEEVLAGADVAERPRLGGEGGVRRRMPEPLLERDLLPLQLPHGRELDRSLRACVEVVVQRPVVEEPHQHECAHREPAPCDGSTKARAALLPRSHAARVLRRAARSCGGRLLDYVDLDD